MISALDQFETDSSTFYSGSYLSDVVFGDSLGGGNTTGNNERSLAGDSATSTNLSTFFNRQYVPYWILQGYASGSFAGRAQRFNRLASDSEIFFDSIMPNPLDIHLRTADDLLFWNISMLITGSERWGIKNVVGTLGVDGTGGIAHSWLGGPQVSVTFPDSAIDTEWYARFPMESKYKGVERLTSFNGLLPRTYTMSTDVENNTVTPVSSSNFLVAAGPAVGLFPRFQLGWMHFAGAPYPTRTNFTSPSNLSNAGSISPNVYFLNFFGIGDGVGGTTIRNKVPTSEVFQLATIFFFPWDFNLRGFKYGVYNANKTSTSCVYRVGKFGQVRDMLEQRPVTKFLDQKTSTTVFSPVSVRFVNNPTTIARSIDYVTATNPDYNTTDSGIYDLEYRSGQPFFDDR